MTVRPTADLDKEYDGILVLVFWFRVPKSDWRMFFFFFFDLQRIDKSRKEKRLFRRDVSNKATPASVFIVLFPPERSGNTVPISGQRSAVCERGLSRCVTKSSPGEPSQAEAARFGRGALDTTQSKPPTPPPPPPPSSLLAPPRF